MNRFVTTVTVVLIGLVPATTLAITRTFSPPGGVSEGDWDIAANWNPAGVPTEADHAVIPQRKTCTVDILTAVADTLTVEGPGPNPEGKLIILHNSKLTLDNDSGNGSTIDGEVFLDAPFVNAAPPTLAFIDQNHVVDGIGQIRGDHASCVITIAPGVVLTSQLAATGKGIRGSLTIMGHTDFGSTGTFVNEGLVESTGHLLLNANLDDSPSALWRVVPLTCSTFVLQFDRQALGLEGDFEAAGALGILRFNASISTCGDLVNYCGQIDVNNGSTFQYVGFSGFCQNPGVGCGGDCLEPCTVSADHTNCCSC